jgi:hypothetical protein
VFFYGIGSARPRVTFIPAVTLSRDGLLQVDRLLHDFFLPQHRQYARYT